MNAFSLVTMILIVSIFFLHACNMDTTVQLPVDNKEETFILSSWTQIESDFDSIKWVNKLDYFDSLGITELLVGGRAESIGKLVPLAINKQIKIHAWLWTLNRPNYSIAMSNPDWYAVNRLGDNSLDYRAYVNYYQWLSPFHPRARNYIKSNVEKLCQIDGIESVHLDYVRFPDVILGSNLQEKYGLKQVIEMPEYDYGYHPIALDSFKSIFGIDPMLMSNPELSNEWRQFRLNAVTSLVGEIKEITNAYEVKLSAAVFPFPEMSRQMVRQNWSVWELDLAFPMLYQNFYNQNINWIGFALDQGINESSFPIRAGLYIPAFKNDKDLAKAIQLCKVKGTAGVSLFTADRLTESQEAILLKLRNNE